jgi:putative transposase
LACSSEQRRLLVEPEHAEISLRRQCELLGVNRSSLYYQPAGESQENLMLMRLIDEQYTRRPFYGSRRRCLPWKVGILQPARWGCLHRR